MASTVVGMTTEHTVSEADVERYHRDGFLAVRNVLTPAEVDEFRTDAQRRLDDQETVVWQGGDGTVMDWVFGLDRSSAPLRRLALHPSITTIAEKLAGRPLRMFKTELLRKAATGAAPTPLHVDAPAFPIEAAPVTLTAWVALVDVPVERGCLTFIPGSHQRPAGAVPGFTEPLDDRPELRWWPRVSVPLRAGDCTFHHSFLVHGAGTNSAQVERISMATVYMDAEAVYRPDPAMGWQDEVPGHEPGQPFDADRYPAVGARA